LPVVEPIAKRTIEAAGLSDRVTTTAGDFFNDPLPSADVITMGLILHDWNLERKLHVTHWSSASWESRSRLKRALMLGLPLPAALTTAGADP
jgi:hypothetical protein